MVDAHASSFEGIWKGLRSFAVRIAVSVIAAAGVTIGAIYFIVDQSTQGLVTAIDQVGRRIDDTNGNILRLEGVANNISKDVQTLVTKIAVVETKLDLGFNETKSEIQKKAHLSPNQDPSLRRIHFAKLGMKVEEQARLKAMLINQPVTVLLPEDDAWASVADNGGFPITADASLDEHLISKLADYYTVSGVSADGLLKAAQRQPLGVTVKSIDGAKFIARVQGGEVIITDETGRQASVSGMGEGGPSNMSTLRIDNVFNLEKFEK